MRESTSSNTSLPSPSARMTPSWQTNPSPPTLQVVGVGPVDYDTVMGRGGDLLHGREAELDADVQLDEQPADGPDGGQAPASQAAPPPGPVPSSGRLTARQIAAHARAAGCWS